MFGRGRIAPKSPGELAAMRRAGQLVASTLALLGERCRPGVTTEELDAMAARSIVDLGGRPSFPEVPGYRHTLCISVNDQVVHGIPGPRRLQPGDLVSIDCGAIVDGWHGDAAISVIAGGPETGRPEDLELIEVTQASLWAGIGAMKVGDRVSDIGAAVQGYAEQAGRERGRSFGVVDGYEGHGIGREMHMAPGVPNVRTRYKGPVITAGSTLAIEPMLTLGDQHTRELEDEWTVVTLDGSRAAHWEHTVAVTDTGLWVLTAADGGRSDLAAAGLLYGGPEA